MNEKRFDFRAIGRRIGASLEYPSDIPRLPDEIIRSDLSKRIAGEMASMVPIEERKVSLAYRDVLECSSRMVVMTEEDYFEMLRVVTKIFGTTTVEYID